MASDTYDLMRVGLEQFAYLKCPSKIRAALINAGGKALSIEEIKARLPERQYVRGANIPEAIEYEQAKPAKAGKPAKPHKLRLTEAERARIAAIAAKVPDRGVPKPNTPGEAYGNELVKYVMREMSITRAEFFGGTRVGHVRAAASLVAVVLRQVDPTLYSYPKIARILGRRDHATIIHAVQRWPDLACKYPQYQALYQRIAARLA